MVWCVCGGGGGYYQGRIQDLWKGGHSGYRERRRHEGFWRVPFEDPLWNFKRGGARPLRPPPPPNPLVITIVSGPGGGGVVRTPRTPPGYGPGKSYMKFHLALFSFTLSDLERSIQVTQVFNGLYLQIRSR